MTDIISTPPAPASPEGAKVLGDGWWPDIDVNQLREEVRLGGTTIPHLRLVAALRLAVADVVFELQDWRDLAEAAGAASLAEVAPDRKIDGQPALEVLFFRAVNATAAADLADRHLDLTATREGTDRAETRTDLASRFRRDATRAIRLITGKTGTMVDLV